MGLVLPLLVAFVVSPARAQADPYAADIAAFKKQDAEHPPAKGQIVFIGSSSFTRWTKVREAFPSHTILNRAFGGSALPDLTKHLDDVVFPYAPRQVVVYCGENDFAYDAMLTAPDVVARFNDLYRRVRARLPDAQFTYVSMKPSPSRWSLAPKFRAANAAIEKFLSHESRASFVDVWPVMLGADGQPIPDIFVSDKLHMNDKGYELWIPLIEKVLVKERSLKHLEDVTVDRSPLGTTTPSAQALEGFGWWIRASRQRRWTSSPALGTSWMSVQPVPQYMGNSSTRPS